ncbi:substrate-binding domain-containing protein [Candidatus Solirubrobacter pratensis]|uniref:substrate-binding domain-containing protein n=1 Tax=Candidatus Solirubrobacter pratensis TaxID=1298857 RepID=UPI000415745C|nr:substrate-binding domain-containing protein [Candidatus Solirubrobacter pratensis]
MKIWPIATVAVSAVLFPGDAVAAAPAPVRMGVVLNALDNPFFLAMYEGTRSEARHLRVSAAVRSVTSNADLAGQAAQVRALGRRDCYVVNPITATNLVGALRRIKRPIVNVDSPIDPAAAKRAGVRVRTYIGTDDLEAGRTGGAKMAALLHGRGDVALVGGLAGNVNSGVRLRGFERGMRGSRLRVVARVNADYDRTKAEIAAERILRDHPRISGFLAASDLMALGIADALRAAGRAGQVRVVGLDGIAEALDAIRTGGIDATVSQYPYVMGRMAVEACAAGARGADLPRRVDAPIALLTKDNVARAIAAFPKPFQPYRDPFAALIRRRG